MSTRALKTQLSSYLQRAESGERIVVLREGTEQQQLLTELEVRGLVTLPRRTERIAFQGPTFPSRGKLASEMVSEDRR